MLEALNYFVIYHLQPALPKTCSCQLTQGVFLNDFHSHPTVSAAVTEEIMFRHQTEDDENKHIDHYH